MTKNKNSGENITGFLRQTNPMLGASRIHSSLGGLCGKYLLGAKYVLSSAGEADSRIRRRDARDRIHKLLSMDRNCDGSSSGSVLLASDRVESRVKTIPGSFEKL